MQNSIIRKIKFPAIDGIRFYAALAVFLEHTLGGAATDLFRIPDSQFGYHVGSARHRLLYYFADGNHGVDVFFIISGFLMARIVLAEGRPFNYLQFLGNRLKRIYPAFVVSLVLAAAADCLLFGWSWHPVDFLKDLVFFNAIPGYSVLPYNHVSWSLGFEFAFYIVIPVLLIVSRIVDRRIAAALLVAVAWHFIPDPFIRMKALFVGSLIGAFSDRQLSIVARRMPLVVALALYLGCGLLKAVYFTTYIGYYDTFLAVAALAFVKIVWDDSHVVARFFAAPPMRTLGTLSYSIYLYHSLVASIVLMYLTPKTASVGATAFYVAVTFGLTLGTAWISYNATERWYFRHAEKRNGTKIPGEIGQQSGL